MPPQQQQIVRRAIGIEGALLVLAVLWARVRSIPLHRMWGPVVPSAFIGLGLGLGLLLLSALMITIGARYFAWCRRMKRLMDHDIAPLFAGLSVSAVLVLAVLSGVGEELLFRGVLQAEIGLVGAGIVFGLAHIWRKDAIIYGVYAAVVGMLLGAAYLLTRSLWTPVMAHVVNNFAAILYCGRMTTTYRPNDPSNSLRDDL